MKRLFLLFIFLLLEPPSGWAWNLSDHRALSRHALQDVAAEWGLDEAVAVRPLSSFFEKLRALRPEIADSWQFSHYLQIDPKIDISRPDSYLYPEASLNDRRDMTVLEILTYYATDPDDGRDQNLFLRDELGRPVAAFQDQKWFGPVQGPNSQAFRHIEKPPFHPAHPAATFGFPFRKLGEASRRTEIYHQLSLLAFALGEDYWGWRFLANSFHYLQDLHQPYHAGQIPPSLLKKGINALSWGWDGKGFIGTLAHIVANSHRFFESYMAFSLAPAKPDASAQTRGRIPTLPRTPIGEIHEALEGKDVAPYPGSFEALAVDIRDESNRVYGKLAAAVSRIADPKLDGPYEFKSDEMGQDDPVRFLNEGPDFASANREIFAVVRDRFASAGRAMRTAVQRIIEEKKETLDPKTLLGRLDELLGPSPFQQESAQEP